MRQFVEKNYLDESLPQAIGRYVASEELEEVCALLARSVPRNGRILELGAGRGLLAGALARKGFNVVALEREGSSVVGVASQSRVHELRAVAWVRGDATALPFPAETFDAVICRSVLHHLSDLGGGLSEARRCTKAGGLFIACNEHILPLWSRGRTFRRSHPAIKYGVDERAYHAWTYTRALRSAGFSHVRFFRNPLDRERFTEVSALRPWRRALTSVPWCGAAFARALHGLHVLIRAYLRVDERALAVVSLTAVKSKGAGA
jgi:SAM-dependent methyltransferase